MKIDGVELVMGDKFYICPFCNFPNVDFRKSYNTYAELRDHQEENHPDKMNEKNGIYEVSNSVIDLSPRSNRSF